MARPPSDLTKFIRALPKNLPVAEVIAKAKAAGHATTEAYVARIRTGGAATAPKKGRSKPASKRAGRKAARPKKAAPAKTVASPEATTTPGTAKSAGVSKSEFIRLHPSLSTAEVIAAGKDQGLTFTSSLVYAVRGKASGDGATGKRTSAAKKPATTKPSAPAPTSKASRPSGSASSVEDLLKAVAAELGLGRAIEILQGERARVRAVFGG